MSVRAEQLAQRTFAGYASANGTATHRRAARQRSCFLGSSTERRRARHSPAKDLVQLGLSAKLAWSKFGLMLGLNSEVRPSCCGAELSDAVEDYLKTIYALSSSGAAATTSVLATWLGVAPPSVSAMVKRLKEADLVECTGRGRVALTAHGRTHALAIVRRHRLLETFLNRVLGVPWDGVHAEAEVLEHALSDALERRIDEVLGHPTRDPHGDPIPPATGHYEEEWGLPLGAAAPGSRFLVERVSDRDSAALRYLAELGIGPGVILTVEERMPFGGPLWVQVSEERHGLGEALTRLVHGRAVESS